MNKVGFKKDEALTYLSPHFPGEDIINSEQTNEFIGQKAIGINKLYQNWTLPYLVITTKVFVIWKNSIKSKRLNIIENILREQIIQLIWFVKGLNFEKAIIRSSAKVEAFEERGEFKSAISSLDVEEIVKVIHNIWSEEEDNLMKGVHAANELALIVQAYVHPIKSGHFSNERRVSRNVNNWILETYNDKGDQVHNDTITVNKNNTLPIIDYLHCRNFKALNNKFKELSKFSYKLDRRCHFEWVWNGKIMYVVQCDIEEEFKGLPPGSEWKIKEKKCSTKDLKCFVHEKNSIYSWNKATHVKTFRNLGFTTGDIFILENPKILKYILNDKLAKNLKEDLNWLIEYPIVIRTSYKNGSNNLTLNLPRTETLFNSKDALEFIKQKVKYFHGKGLKIDEYAFLIHRFIISKSCALALSKPNSSKVRIDSSWGFADGLGFNPYDTFELDTSSNVIKKQIRCKKEYLDVDAKGNWILKEAGTLWDWKQSLTPDELKKIAEISLKISHELQSEVIVMFFIGGDQTIINPKILPWHYSTKEIPQYNQERTLSESVFSIKKFTISNESDFLFIKKRVEDDSQNSKVTLVLKLDTNLLRNTDFITKVGAFAKRHHCYIELIGSLLSHVYYILSRDDVKVKCLFDFKPSYEKQEFNKLVRDRVPDKINSKGEVAKVHKISSKRLMQLLKTKAVEEAFELFYENNPDNIVEELADILEVTRSLAKVVGIDFSDLQAAADKKRLERGGFEEGVFLEETTEVSLIQNVNNINKKTNPTNNRKHMYNNKILYNSNELTIPLIPFANSNIKAIHIKEISKDVVLNYSKRGLKISFRPPNTNYVDPDQLSIF